MKEKLDRLSVSYAEQCALDQIRRLLLNTGGVDGAAMGPGLLTEEQREMAMALRRSIQERLQRRGHYDPHAVDDAVGDLALSLLRRKAQKSSGKPVKGGYDGVSPPSRYVYGAAFNAARTQSRKLAAARTEPVDSCGHDRGAPDPRETSERRETIALTRALAFLLPAQEARAIGREHPELATVHDDGRPDPNQSVSLHRARERLACWGWALGLTDNMPKSLERKLARGGMSRESGSGLAGGQVLAA